MSEDDMISVKDSIKSIESNITKVNENFTNFCLAITSRVITLETKAESHDILHMKQEKMQADFEEKLAKRTGKQMTILALILSFVSIVSGILTKLIK